MANGIGGTVIEVWTLTFVLVLARAGTFVFFLPVTGGRNTPHTIKVGLTVALAVFWFSVWGTSPSAEFIQLAAGKHWLAYSVALFRETILGALLGFLFGMLMVPARIAGSYVAQEMGLTMATISDPVTRQPASVLTHIFEALTVLVFFGLDVHHVLLLAMHSSFQLWSIGAPIPDSMILIVAAGVSDANEWGLMLAAPVGICLFIATIVLLLLNRASPQLNLFSVGIVLRIATGLGAMMLFVPVFIASLSRFFANTSSTIRSLFYF
ncbi:MAG: flagellar biosynthetic protein FliR [Planctomycetaceae bacterium]